MKTFAWALSRKRSVKTTFLALLLIGTVAIVAFINIPSDNDSPAPYYGITHRSTLINQVLSKRAVKRAKFCEDIPSDFNKDTTWETVHDWDLKHYSDEPSLQTVLDRKYGLTEPLVVEGRFVILDGDEATSLVCLGLGSECLVVAAIVCCGSTMDYELRTLVPLAMLLISYRSSSNILEVRNDIGQTQVFQLCSCINKTEIWDLFTSNINKLYQPATDDDRVSTSLTYVQSLTPSIDDLCTECQLHSSVPLKAIKFASGSPRLIPVPSPCPPAVTSHNEIETSSNALQVRISSTNTSSLGMQWLNAQDFLEDEKDKFMESSSTSEENLNYLLDCITAFSYPTWFQPMYTSSPNASLWTDNSNTSRVVQPVQKCPFEFEFRSLSSLQDSMDSRASSITLDIEFQPNSIFEDSSLNGHQARISFINLSDLSMPWFIAPDFLQGVDKEFVKNAINTSAPKKIVPVSDSLNCNTPVRTPEQSLTASDCFKQNATYAPRERIVPTNISDLSVQWCSAKDFLGDADNESMQSANDITTSKEIVPSSFSQEGSSTWSPSEECVTKSKESTPRKDLECLSTSESLDVSVCLSSSEESLSPPDSSNVSMSYSTYKSVYFNAKEYSVEDEFEFVTRFNSEYDTEENNATIDESITEFNVLENEQMITLENSKQDNSNNNTKTSPVVERNETKPKKKTGNRFKRFCRKYFLCCIGEK